VERQRLRAFEPPGLVDDFGVTEADAAGRATWSPKSVQHLRQRDPSARRHHHRDSRAESRILVGLLGGDGLVSRVVTLSGRTDAVTVTCDASPFMVSQDWAGGIPALLQRAEALLFRDGPAGGVLLALRGRVGLCWFPGALRADVAVLPRAGDGLPAGSQLKDWPVRVPAFV